MDGEVLFAGQNMYGRYATVLLIVLEDEEAVIG
jgi:hypothetical protein